MDRKASDLTGKESKPKLFVGAGGRVEEIQVKNSTKKALLIFGELDVLTIIRTHLSQG